MSHLELTTLGAFQIQLDGQTLVTFRTDKASALMTRRATTCARRVTFLCFKCEGNLIRNTSRFSHGRRLTLANWSVRLLGDQDEDTRPVGRGIEEAFDFCAGQLDPFVSIPKQDGQFGLCQIIVNLE